MQPFLIINEKDSVAVALRDLQKGESFDFVNGSAKTADGSSLLTLADDIPRGHKFALRNLEKGENVIKYGYPIGHALTAIEAGSHVHVHNLMTNLGDDEEYIFEPETVNAKNLNDLPDRDENGKKTENACEVPGVQATGTANVPELKEAKENNCDKFFRGYERTDGRVGVRNELWIVPTVGCVNSVAGAIEKRCRGYVGKNVEAVVSFRHPYGCSQMGDDQENTREALAALIKHPNAGGVLVVGLGCENSNIEILKGYLGDYGGLNIEFLNCQDEEDEIEAGEELMKKLYLRASKNRRTKQPLSRLVVGLKCGGSDGLSGITANPSVGRFSDILTGLGGTTILTEVPEMFGAERILMNRACSEEVFEKTVSLINDFKDYYRKNDQTIYENPSPGNKAGGISTLEDKALGCTQKSGTSAVTDVLKYAEPVKASGLNLLSAPGNDLVAATALALSGAQIILFTTGRGTPFASVVPTVKISTNTPLAEKKSKWIDFDCGILLKEGETVAGLGARLFDYVLEVASGSRVKSETEGFRDLAVFKTGVTL